MKNLRIAKKNPSKILKIIDMPQTHRYISNPQNTNFSHRIQELAIGQYKDKQSKQLNFSTYRQKISRSPSNSQKIMQISSVQKHNKIKSKSLNRSEENIINQEMNQLKQNTKQSIELKPRQELSPYVKRNKNKEENRLFNFHSVNLNKQKKSLERESSNDSNRRRYSHLKMQRNTSSQPDKKSEDEVLDNAKQLLSNGQYRKSLLLLKSVLKTKPQNVEGLYLSAVNWYHLEDKSKVHFFTEQIINLNPCYSADCYKIKAVCYFKTLQYSKSLAYLKKCHQRFPEESESYDLEGKVYMKMKKWKEALDCYLKAYQFTKNVDSLGNVAFCYQELNKLDKALQCYEIITHTKNVLAKYLLRKIKINIKLQRFQEVTQLFELFQNRIGNLKDAKEKEQLWYNFTYAHYKLKKFSKALILIDQGLKCCQHQALSYKFNRILLMIKIEERDLYEAYHISQRLQEAPQLFVIKRFIEGVINLMRRNYNQAINILFSIQKQLGFNLDPPSRFSNRTPLQFQKVQLKEIEDQFLKQIRKIFLMFLSYAYYNISEFHSAKKLIQLQREIGVSHYFELGLSYNYEMSLGIISHCDRKFKEAESHFIKAKAMYENKLEPPFSLALNYLQLLHNQEDEVEKLQIIQKAKGEFWTCKKIIGKTCNNTAASLYYFSSLLHGYLEEWKEAIISIDVSIQRSEDHYWRYYYIRGMLLACIHSFKEAIGDLTAAINLSANTKPECFLLRSKCLQIEGEGNDAFKDLQEYISLKPDDPEVHKYAGQLLFENGAFEDSLTAFHHQTVPKCIQNYDMFLTEGKSYFLLGKFKEAIQAMSVSNEIKTSEVLKFDIEVIKILDLMISNAQPGAARIKLQQIFGDFSKLGKIFKITDFYVLKATCLILQEKYEQAVEPLLIAIKEKEKQLIVADEQDEIAIIQNKKDLDTFVNQMKYNIVICKLNSDNLPEAKKILQQIHIPFDQFYYPDFLYFKKFVSQEIQILKKQEVFPNRNKLSNFIPKIKLKAKSRNVDDRPNEVKLCIPFPKVEPPEIFPTFNVDLILKLSVMNVERKPEAPWILRENNSIKFTQKIETFSRLQLQDSEFDSSSTYQVISVQNDHLSKKSSRSRRIHTSELEVQITSEAQLKKFIQ